MWGRSRSEYHVQDGRAVFPATSSTNTMQLMRRRRESQMSQALSGDNQARTPSQSPARCAVFARRYASSLSEDSGWAGSFVSMSSGSDSSIMVAATLYFSMAQFPRSRSRQRSLQNGKSEFASES